MVLKITSLPLTNAVEWDALKAIISPEPPSRQLQELLSNLQKRLSELGVVSAAIEHEYLDRDFTAEFSSFYAKLFRRYAKICKRIHFFSADFAPILATDDPVDVMNRVGALDKQKHYLGFSVIRPVAHAPIGRTILAAPKSPAAMNSKLLVRAAHEVHLLGATLTVTGVPMMQQDTRVGACAQAAIWIAGRHFHTKHRGPWISVNEITEEALKPVDTQASMALPAGSSALTIDNMVRALRFMGREPFSYIHPRHLNLGNAWMIDPAAAIARYIDSGIPVILGMRAFPGTFVGHALVVVGQTTKTLPAAATLPANPTRSVFCEAFLVNDDQRGPYMRLPLSAGSTVAETVYDVAQYVDYILVPLPSKVFLPAESAEEVAWDLLRTFYVAEMPKVKADKTFDIGKSDIASDGFIGALAQNKVIARTYLTYGWKYRLRMLNNICSVEIKKALIRHDLPKYVWVTEFGTLDSMNHLEPGEKRIFGHAVVDATSSRFHKSALFFHAPGLIKRWFHKDGASADGSFADDMGRIKDDVPYYPKVRGLIKP